ncbi:MarR family transcriptional regulator [Streptomyces goshikiensis]|uniref:MarR family transcriptional regulator n=1 Tax=Streptomyces goshikiensis TaxID=1942 RepID=UPI00368A046F
MHQATRGELLGLSRPSVSATLWELELELAKLVKKVRNGVYQINPMLAGYNSPEDALDAVKAMPKADRLDSKTYVADYNRTVAAYQDQLAEQRKKCAAAAAAKKATAAKRRGSLHAVG